MFFISEKFQHRPRNNRMKVKPYFRTTLAKPYQGKHYHEAGASVVGSLAPG